MNCVEVCVLVVQSIHYCQSDRQRDDTRMRATCHTAASGLRAVVGWRHFQQQRLPPRAVPMYIHATQRIQRGSGNARGMLCGGVQEQSSGRASEGSSCLQFVLYGVLPCEGQCHAERLGRIATVTVCVCMSQSLSAQSYSTMHMSCSASKL